MKKPVASDLLCISEVPQMRASSFESKAYAPGETTALESVARAEYPLARSAPEK